MRSEFAEFNDYLLSEILNEEYGTSISRSSVRAIRREAGLPGPRKRRAPQHRSRRERFPRRGMLLQIDCSDHDRLERRGPGLTLISAIDDATGEIPFAPFRPEEDAAGYFLLLEAISQHHSPPTWLATTSFASSTNGGRARTTRCSSQATCCPSRRTGSGPTTLACPVEVPQHLDKRLSIWFQGQRLAVHQPEMAGSSRTGEAEKRAAMEAAGRPPLEEPVQDRGQPNHKNPVTDSPWPDHEGGVKP